MKLTDASAHHHAESAAHELVNQIDMERRARKLEGFTDGEWDERQGSLTHGIAELLLAEDWPDERRAAPPAASH